MMKRIMVFLVVLTLWASGDVSASNLNLLFQSTYQLSSEPLTTEKIWSLDPNQPNPHIQRWVISRTTDLYGLKAIKLKNDKYELTASGLSTAVQGYIRGLGPWYRPETEFSCTEKPNAWFATQEGSKLAASEAASIWFKIISEKKLRLSVILERITADSEELALDRGKEAFRNWIDAVEESWRHEVQEKVREAEWKFYLSEPSMKLICKNKNRPPIVAPTLRSMMESIVGDPLPISKILARAPVRLWDGLASVRLNISIGGKSLNGKFLIDSSAYKSVISPTWLEAQGINTGWVVIPGSVPQKVRYSELWGSEHKLSRRAFVDHVEMSGLTLPINEFLLAETDFFSPPEYVGSCCDGILGMDFLRSYPLQFRTAGPRELIVWPKEGFHWGAEVPWVEVTEKENATWVSACVVSPENVSFKKHLNLLGVSWDTGNEDPMVIHTPWQKEAKSLSSNSWSIYCDGVDVAKEVEASFPKPSSGVSAEGLFAVKVPAVSVGMPVLSKTGEFTIDIPHGRLWLNGGTRNFQFGFKNVSGLKVKYILNEGDRELRVQEIQPRTPAAILLKEGLRAGMLITQIDSKPAHDIDLWEVERRLAGAYGSQVTLQWKTKSGLKMAPLKVRD